MLDVWYFSFPGFRVRDKKPPAPTAFNPPLADIQPRHARIVIRDLIRIANPRIHMDMLHIGPPSRRTRDLRTDEDMVQFLAVHLEQVGISLGGGNAGRVVEVDEARDGGE